MAILLNDAKFIKSFMRGAVQSGKAMALRDIAGAVVGPKAQ